MTLRFPACKCCGIRLRASEITDRGEVCTACQDGAE